MMIMMLRFLGLTSLYSLQSSAQRLLGRRNGRSALVCIILFTAIANSACSDEPSDEDGVIGTGILLRGTVSALASAPGNRVDVKSSNARFTELAIDSDNQFSASILRGTGPWVLRARTDGDRVLYGIAYTDGNRNINSFSDLILRNWFAQQSIDLDTDFDSSQSFTALPDASEFADVATGLFGLIDPVLRSYSVNGEDIISGEIIANGLGLDAFLNQNTVIIENGRVSFVLTDPVTITRSATSSTLALSSDFLDTGTTGPSVPQQVRAIGSAADEIVLLWEPSTDDVAVLGYRVIRDGSVVATTPYPVYVDSSLPLSQTFIYEIVAIDEADNVSNTSDPVIASGLLMSNTVPPPAPMLLTKLSATNSNVLFNWSQSEIGNVIGFNVYRGSDALSLEFLVRVTSTLATDINVRRNETYCYQVAALNGSGVESDLSDVLCVTTNDSDSANDVSEPLPDWNIPDIEALEAADALDCSQALWTIAVQRGVTVITDDCVRVPETLVIGAGATLQVPEGVVMKFSEGAKLVVPRYATLTINGTPDSPVVMTGSITVPGHWGGIEFQNSSSSANLLRGAVIQYAGGADTRAAIALSSGKSRFRMENTLVRFNQSNALDFAIAGTVVESFRNNRITENESVGTVSLDLLYSLAGNSEFTGNEQDDILVPSDSYEYPITIPNLRVPLVWDGVSMQRASLTIEPGADLRMVPRSEIKVEGAITANGTAEQPIVIKGNLTSQGQGSWTGIQLSGRGNKTINHLTLSYAGNAGEGNGAIKVDCTVEAAAKIQMDNVDIADSASWGIFVSGAGCITDLGKNMSYFNNDLGNARVP